MGLWETFIILAGCVAVSWQQGTTTSTDFCNPACRHTPLDVAFVIDGSTSIRRDDFTRGITFVKEFVALLNIRPDQARVAAVAFADNVFTQDDFGFAEHTNLASLQQGITAIRQRFGNTGTGNAIKYVRDTFLPQARAGVKKVCIVLTDGNSQEGRKTHREANLTRAAGMEMIAIGVGSVSRQELRNIAGDESNVFSVSNYNSLNTIKEQLANETCHVDPPVVVCRDRPIDISFILDASRSIGSYAIFNQSLQFAKDFVRKFNVSPEQARFSLITFAHGTYNNSAFYFNTHNNKQGVLDAISAVPFAAGGRTDTGLGIAFMRVEQMLAHRRPSATHIAIVMTDGDSHEPQKTRTEAALARDDDINMFAIGVGNRIQITELRNIAGNSANVVRTTSYGALSTILDILDNKICELVNESDCPS
ncbi:vitrin-like [Haliotis cracherodii]|uniref:vitrin-like n=1 Tax=Haliotis cracherodii TaxID=6455 RepID=UPI0039ED8082